MLGESYITTVYVLIFAVCSMNHDQQAETAVDYVSYCCTECTFGGFEL